MTNNDIFEGTCSDGMAGRIVGDRVCQNFRGMEERGGEPTERWGAWSQVLCRRRAQQSPLRVTTNSGLHVWGAGPGPHGPEPGSPISCWSSTQSRSPPSTQPLF